LTCPARAFLSPGLLAAATHLAAGQGVRRANALTGEVANDGLVDQTFIHRLTEHTVVQLGLADDLACQIVNRNFHRCTPRRHSSITAKSAANDGHK
jgi:hypothetical protein